MIRDSLSLQNWKKPINDTAGASPDKARTQIRSLKINFKKNFPTCLKGVIQLQLCDMIKTGAPSITRSLNLISGQQTNALKSPLSFIKLLIEFTILNDCLDIRK